MKATASSGRGYVTLVCLISALGGLLFGFDTAVISGAIGSVQSEFQLGAGMTGWVVSSALVGCMLGAMVAGPWGDRFGRRHGLLVSALLFIFSAVACGLSRSASELIAARLWAGAGVGIASMLVPLYIAEISPVAWRGRLVSLQQFAIISGILFAYLSNALIVRMATESAEQWRLMFAVGAVPAFVFFVLLLLVPESPRWLAQHGELERAGRILARITGGNASEMDLAAMKGTPERGTLGMLFRQPGPRAALAVGVTLAVLQQITGINAVLYYAPEIFRQAGAVDAIGDTVWIGLVNFAFTCVASALVDRWGRKPLLLAGAIGMTCSLGWVSAAYAFHLSPFCLLAGILAYVASFAASFGPVVWVVLAEIFPARVRGRALSVATVVLWSACFAVSQSFPVLVAWLGSALTFALYTAASLLSILYVAWRVPETRGVPLEEIEQIWERASRGRS
ncbi:MAG: xylE 1 [Verrucomicrobia bacterium]|nr:xylE 1 [Verrucomicrobiota bacterium]